MIITEFLLGKFHSQRPCPLFNNIMYADRKVAPHANINRARQNSIQKKKTHLLSTAPRARTVERTSHHIAADDDVAS